MGFWNKLGKTLLTAAPYIAAPFTGGASLAATGLANKAVQKWSQHDAEKAVAKGLAPSKFDQVLGKVGGYAGLASSFLPTGALGSIGLLGKTGSAANAIGKTASAVNNVGKGTSILSKIGQGAGIVGKTGTGWQGTLKAALDSPLTSMAVNRIGSSGSGTSSGGDGGGYAGGQSYFPTAPVGDIMPQGGYDYQHNPMNQVNQNNPNLSMSIFQGRQDALGGQVGRGQNYTPTQTTAPRRIRPSRLFQPQAGQ